MRIFKFVLGKVLGGLFAIAAMVLLVGVWKLQILPATLVALVGVLMALITALVVVLTWTGEGKVRMTVGIVLAVIGIAIQCVGSFFVWPTVNALGGFNPGETETVIVGGYMRADDARDLAADLKFGLLTTDDRQVTDSAVQKLNKDLDAEITCAEYESPVALLEALLKDDLDVMILNQAYLDVLVDLPGYEEKIANIREVFQYSVEVEISEEENKGNEEEPDQPEYTSLKDSFAVYISGIDARGGKVSIKSRSDVNIVAVVNPKTRQVLLVNTPRDYYVTISSPQEYLDGKKDKLTHAGLGGANASRETLSNLYGIDISYYFKVNFSGFVDIVDALDGITVHSDFDFRYTDDDGTVYYYQKGDNELSGKAALGFCRNRYSFADGDNQRGKNQMLVIKAVINKVLSPKLLTNYTQILDAVSGSMEMTVPMDVIGDLVSQQLSEGGSWNVVSYSVTGSGGYEKSPAAGGAEAYMMFPDEESVERAKELIQDVIDGKIVTP